MAANILRIKALFFSTLCVVLCGCMSPSCPPPSTLRINQVETGPLRGKTIVIDPGHGGPEHGAVGPQGVQEAEVNLGVALYLWGLLKYAGANALLTRSADTSVDRSAAFSLDKDLDARSSIGNQKNADLFVSIHHNSDIKHRNRNDIQIYYKMSDTGPSRDAAKCILQGLKQQLDVSEGAIYPGNYRVLRTSNAAAILGESSFLSNKRNEGKLSFQRTLQREAEGYFNGILLYFQKGVPVIAELYPEQLTLPVARPEIKVRIISGSGNNPVDPSSIIIKLDYKRCSTFSFHKNGMLLFAPPQPLRNGQHTVCINLKNMAGNSAAEKRASFTISLPPASIELKPVFPVIPPDGVSSTAIDVSVLDALKRPVIDGTTVTFATTGGRFVEPVVLTKGGHARAILISDRALRTAAITASAGAVHAKSSIRFAGPAQALFLASIRDSSGNFIAGAELIANGKEVAVADEHGLAFVSTMYSGAAVYIISKNGFYPVSLKTVLNKGSMVKENITLNQIDEGILLNKKIIIDPAGFTTQALPIVTELKKKIEYAGGYVFITWEKEPAPSLKERILFSSRLKADLFIAIEITKRDFSAGYYSKSTVGKLLSENVCQEFKNNTEGKWRKCMPLVSEQYMIIQTAMPAVWIKLPNISLNKTSTVVSNIYNAILNTLNKNK